MQRRFERIVARQREINAATTSLASLIEEVARELDSERDRGGRGKGS